MVGLLFQPRRMTGAAPAVDVAPHAGEPADRERLFRLALQDVLVGDTSRFGAYFTDDLTLTSPHAAATSRGGAQRAFSGSDDALSGVTVTLHPVGTVGDTLFVEWRLEATFSAPLLFDDDLVIEPIGGPVRLHGASVAEFRGSRIAVFRHCFDDSEIFDGLPGVAAHLRWLPAEPRLPT